MRTSTAPSASTPFGAKGLRSALQALPDAVAIVDGARRVLYVNASFETTFGYAGGALLGQSVGALFEDADERAEMEPRLFDPTALETPSDELVKFRRENGGVFPGETTSSRILDDGGACIGVIAVIRDVGEQRLADETLHGLYALSSAPELCAEEKVERILGLGAAYYGLENAVIGQVVDDRYRVEYALGPATRRGRGYALSETFCGPLLASGAPVSVMTGDDLAGREHLGVSGDALGAYVGAPVFVNDRAIGGLSFFGGAEGRPLPAGAADFARLFAHWIGYQLTHEKVLQELRSAHEAAQENYRAAEVASRAKSRFLATMSHELRTPLNAILGFADLTAERLHGESSEKYFEYAADISRSATKLLDMIDDLLSMSRLETGQIQLVEETFDPIEEIQLAVMKHRPAATAAGLELTAAPDAPRMSLRAERKAFRQVLGNLISNAIKFTDPGGGVHIDVVVDAKGAASIRVIDTGRGIPESELGRVFYPFERNDGDDTAMTANAGGSGLGLTICRELMEAHDGALTLASVVGEGTVASMVWPADRTVYAEPIYAAAG